MYKARRYLDKRCLANLYHTYIYPYLIYCVEIWGNVPSCHLNPLYLMQKKIVRIITFSNYLAHTEPIFKQLNILPIDKLYYNRIGILMYKYSNGQLPEVMDELYLLYLKGTTNFTHIIQEAQITFIYHLAQTYSQALVLELGTN